MGLVSWVCASSVASYPRAATRRHIRHIRSLTHRGLTRVSLQGLIFAAGRRSWRPLGPRACDAVAWRQGRCASARCRSCVVICVVNLVSMLPMPLAASMLLNAASARYVLRARFRSPPLRPAWSAKVWSCCRSPPQPQSSASLTSLPLHHPHPSLPLLTPSPHPLRLFAQPKSSESLTSRPRASSPAVLR